MTQTPDNAETDPTEVPLENEAESASSEETGTAPAADAAAVDLSAHPSEEIEKWKDIAARTQADLDNYRKRMAREKQEAIQYANRNLLEQLLPIIDNFEMGLKAAESAEGGELILQGLGMVRKQLEDFLSDQGVETIPSDGLAFDPNIHEALRQEAHDSIPEGHIAYTIRRGYWLKDRVLRAASVVVSSGSAASE